MANLEPETEATSSLQDEINDGGNNLSAISFTESEEAKGLGAD